MLYLSMTSHQWIKFEAHLVIDVQICYLSVFLRYQDALYDVYSKIVYLPLN